VVDSSSAEMINNTIARNGQTGVLLNNTYWPSEASFVNNIVVNHVVGFYFSVGSTVTMESTLFGEKMTEWENSSDWAGPVTIVDPTVWGDPAFVDPDHGDYHLTAASDAIDRGVWPGGVVAAGGDIDGDERRVDGNENTIIVTDMGADEYDPDNPPPPPPPSLVVVYLPLVMYNSPPTPLVDRLVIDTLDTTLNGAVWNGRWGCTSSQNPHEIEIRWHAESGRPGRQAWVQVTDPLGAIVARTFISPSAGNWTFQLSGHCGQDLQVCIQEDGVDGLNDCVIRHVDP
jgi:hypothetical protein